MNDRYSNDALEFLNLFNEKILLITVAFINVQTLIYGTSDGAIFQSFIKPFFKTSIFGAPLTYVYLFTKKKQKK